LEIEQNERVNPMAETKEIKKEKSNLKKRKDCILIVDDEHSIREVLKEFLNSKSFVAHAVPMADDAIEILNTIEVDLVITNVNMPGMDGLELTRLIKDRYSARVIILTGYRKGCTQEDAHRAGADDLLYKPATLKELLSSINRILNKKNSEISG
jgi:two-component system cell cycle response regulator